MEAVDDQMGAGFHHGNADRFDQAAGAHGAINAAYLGTQVSPVVDFRTHAPGTAAKGP
ncbi:hypothetical protein D3C76_1715590 [compost metagenome]